MGISFTDGKKREWTPRINTRIIRDFETRSGIDFFGVVFDVMNAIVKAKSSKKKKQDAVSQDEIQQIFRQLFGNVGNLAFVLYESCRNIQGKVVDKVSGSEITFDDFCSAIGTEESVFAVAAGIKLIFSYYPEIKPGEATAGENEDSSDFQKLPGGLGEVFTSWRE